MMKPGDIDVVVLCGGLGTRLQSVVKDRPKPMADIGGKPFLAFLLDHLAQAGFSRFILCTGYKSEKVSSFFRKHDRPYSVAFSKESRPLGTGGALRHAGRLIHSDTALVMNGDSLSSVDYESFVHFHETARAEVSIAICRMKSAGEYGKVIIGSRGIVKGFQEKKSGAGSGWVNTGVYLFQESVVKSLSRKTPLSLEHDVFPSLAGKKLFAFKTGGSLMDIGTPERYQAIQKTLKGIMSRRYGQREV